MAARAREVADFAHARSLADGTRPKQAAPGAAEAPPTDADFKSFVLYVHGAASRSPECIRALEALTTNPNMKLDTLIQDVDALPMRPQWLSSVPCLVVKAERRALTADACVAFIASHKARGVPPSFARRSGKGHKRKDVWSSE